MKCYIMQKQNKIGTLSSSFTLSLHCVTLSLLSLTLAHSLFSTPLTNDSALAKKMGGRKTTKVLGIPKLDDANNAGGRKGNGCTLILTEGDSAKSLAIAGKDNDFDLFSLKTFHMKTQYMCVCRTAFHIVDADCIEKFSLYLSLFFFLFLFLLSFFLFFLNRSLRHWSR